MLDLFAELAGALTRAGNGSFSLPLTPAKKEREFF